MAVHGLCPADIGGSILANGNLVFSREFAWHAGTPQHFITDVPENELMQLGQLFEACIDVGMDAGDQLEL